MSKDIICHLCCEKPVMVEDEYKEKYCCAGLSNECGCMGAPTNPVFCDECDNKLKLGNQDE